MADSEHLKHLEQSIEEWNQWRLDHPEIEPNLRGADFTHLADFQRSRLFNTAFTSVPLSHVNLSYANLNHANLRGINLSGANLHHANLSYANLFNAILSQADLSDANLIGADLSDAFCPEANFSGAMFADTIFGHNVDLRLAKGLVEIHHANGSRVELHTLRLPQDGSAVHFLRGAGVPEEWINFYQTTMMYPIQYYSCFISYSSMDEHIAKRLHADLQANGVRCWFAPHDLKPGDYIRKEIDQAIHLQDKLLLILSKHAINSGWVSHEVELALAREMRQQREILFPIRLDNEVLQSTSHWATTLQATRQIGDFTNWTDPQTYQQAFDRLLRDLKKVNQ